MSEIEPVKVTAKELRDLFPDELDHSESIEFAYLLTDGARSQKDIGEAFRILAETTGFDVEAIDVEGENFGRYWLDTRAIYINFGHTDVPTLIYDTKEKEFYVEGYGDYVQYIEPVYWEIQYAVEDEAGNVMTLYVTVQEDSEKEALQAFVDAADDGDPVLWGEDHIFDPFGGVETSEKRLRSMDPDYESLKDYVHHQLWYVTGVDDLAGEEEEEVLTKSLQFSSIKQVGEGEGRGDILGED